MKRTTIHEFKGALRLNPRFRTGISLHGHTLHSREPLGFLHAILRRYPLLDWAVRREEEQRLGRSQPRLDFSRLWWTPPLCPRQAWDTEASQIARVLGLRPLVSLTDHDTADAPLALRIVQPDVPLSIEWTIYTGPTFLHLGVHNLPPGSAPQLLSALKEATRAKAGGDVTGLLAELCRHPGVLTVLNHPLWDEGQIGADLHRRHMLAFLQAHKPWVHALELNGFRPREEHRDLLRLASELNLPVTAGGDRHGRTPSSLVQLTAAESFDEFADEVRSDGWSDVLLLPPYHESRTLRIMHEIGEIVRDAPDHALGWTRWSDRIFFLSQDGLELPASSLWADGRAPLLPDRFVALMSRLGALTGGATAGERTRPAWLQSEEASL